jgi:hypothetical protein
MKQEEKSEIAMHRLKVSTFGSFFILIT